MLMFRVLNLLLLLVLAFQASLSHSDETSHAPFVAKRIVALSPHSVELLFSLGAGSRIVATTSYADFPDEAKRIPQVGGYNGIQLESVLALKPDLIVAWEGGNPAGDIDRLERLGLKVYRSETKRMADIETEIIELGALTGLNAKAAELVATFKQDWQGIQKENHHKAPISFFYQLWNEPLRTIGAGSWINEILTSCGGVNIFDDTSLDYPQVSLEVILKAKPKVIIVPSHHGAELGDAQQWATWREIPAVRNQHIFSVNGDVMHRFSLRVIDGMKSVCSALDQVRARS